MIETALFLLDGKCSKLKVKNFGSFEKVVGVIENGIFLSDVVDGIVVGKRGHAEIIKK